MMIQSRLQGLQAEHQKGRAALASLRDQREAIAAQEAQIAQTLARIEGAIQVLTEMAGEEPNGAGAAIPASPPGEVPPPRDK